MKKWIIGGLILLFIKPIVGFLKVFGYCLSLLVSLFFIKLFQGLLNRLNNLF